MTCAVGQVWHHRSYYLDNETGEWKGKYFAVLAVQGTEIVYRLLTSRAHGRGYYPACFHGDPYPGYYLGVLGGALHKDSWLDLQETEDFDSIDFGKKIQADLVEQVASIPREILCEALLCAANAPDTRRRQTHLIYSSRAALGC